jgi:hypothetical protein
MSPQASPTKCRTSVGGPTGAFRPLASICGLSTDLRKSLSMPSEVGSLAGDRVLSHERSRPADLSRRDRLCSRNAGSYPSNCCGCFSRCALLAYSHRCRNAVTVDGACKHRQSIGPDKTTSFSAAACGRSGFRKWATRVDHLIGCTIDDFATRTWEIAIGPPERLFRPQIKPTLTIEVKFPA